jgi:hypothetical protein
MERETIAIVMRERASTEGLGFYIGVWRMCCWTGQWHLAHFVDQLACVGTVVQ